MKEIHFALQKALYPYDGFRIIKDWTEITREFLGHLKGKAVILSNEQYRALYDDSMKLKRINSYIDDFYKTIETCKKCGKKHQGVVCIR